MRTHTVPHALPFPGPFQANPTADTSDHPTATDRHRAARLRLVGSVGTAGSADALPAPTLGTHRDPSPRRRWARHGWPIVELLGVAALIIGLVSVIMGGLDGNDGGRPAVIPMAGVGTATPEPGSDEVAALPDPGQTGVMPGPGIDGDPELIWRVPIEDVTSDLFVSDGTVVRAHFSDEIPADFPNTTNPWTIDALSARAGTPIWSTEVDASGVQIGGIWQRTIVVVASGEYGPIRIGDEEIGDGGQGLVVGLDLATGAVQWSRSLVNEVSGPPALTVPTISNGIAYVPTTLGPMYSVDITDGSINWTATIDDLPLDQLDGASFSRPAVSNGVVSAYSMATGKVYALDAGTGKPIWSTRVADPLIETPIGTPTDGLYTTNDVPSVSTPAIADDTLYLSLGWYTGDAAQSLMAIDVESGTELWTTDLGSIDLSDVNRQRGVSQPYVTDDAVIVSIGGSDGNRLIASATGTGDQLWELPLSDEQSSAMSIVGDTGYVGGADGTLTAVDLAIGEETWSLELGGAASRAPFVIDGVIYQASEDDQLYAIGGSGSSEATPGASTNISGLASCDVEPRAPASELFAMAAEQTPVSTLVEPVSVGTEPDQFLTAPTIAWDDLPVGTPADAEVATAIQQTVDGISTCTRAGDQAQVAAYYSDDFFSRPYNQGVAKFSDNYFPSSEIPVMSGDLRVLDDGRVGMIATEGLISREIGQNQATLYIFAEQPDDQWLIDEVVIVNNNGLAPQG